MGEGGPGANDGFLLAAVASDINMLYGPEIAACVALKSLANKRAVLVRIVAVDRSCHAACCSACCNLI